MLRTLCPLFAVGSTWFWMVATGFHLVFRLRRGFRLRQGYGGRDGGWGRLPDEASVGQVARIRTERRWDGYNGYDAYFVDNGMDAFSKVTFAYIHRKLGPAVDGWQMIPHRQISALGSGLFPFEGH
jgi:hypothetical protein